MKKFLAQVKSLQTMALNERSLRKILAHPDIKVREARADLLTGYLIGEINSAVAHTLIGIRQDRQDRGLNPNR